MCSRCSRDRSRTTSGASGMILEASRDRGDSLGACCRLLRLPSDRRLVAAPCPLPASPRPLPAALCCRPVCRLLPEPFRRFLLPTPLRLRQMRMRRLLHCLKFRVVDVSGHPGCFVCNVAATQKMTAEATGRLTNVPFRRRECGSADGARPVAFPKHRTTVGAPTWRRSRDPR